jgi:hypothetical protein
MREGYASLRKPGFVAVGGDLWWLGVAGVSGDVACIARADSGNDRFFSNESNGSIFLFGFVYFCLFTVYLCNG